MIQIRLNEENLKISSQETLAHLIQIHDPRADVIIYNGFAISHFDFTLQEGDEIYLICRGRELTQQQLEHLMQSRHTPKIAEKLKKATLVVAGLGGLGSNIAVALSRIGIGHLILVDFDVVEPSNLNRQQYFIHQLGLLKTEALAQTLKQINPYNQLSTYPVKMAPDNIPGIVRHADIVLEAFDKADAKAMLIKECAKLDKIVIAASGMAGYGRNDSILTRKINEKLYIIGDFESEAKPGNGLMAPRVMIAAAKQANLAVELLLNH